MESPGRLCDDQNLLLFKEDPGEGCATSATAYLNQSNDRIMSRE